VGVAIANATLITPKMTKMITEAPSQLLQRKVVSIRLPPKGVWKHLGAEASQDLLRRKSIDVLLGQKSEDACDELARTIPRDLSHRPISSGSPATSYQAPSAVAWHLHPASAVKVSPPALTRLNALIRGPEVG
jgi:hypothetical protein